MKTWVLYWTFKNDHSWHQEFDTKNEAEHYANTCGLHSHPDIIDIRIENIKENISGE